MATIIGQGGLQPTATGGSNQGTSSSKVSKTTNSNRQKSGAAEISSEVDPNKNVQTRQPTEEEIIRNRQLEQAGGEKNYKGYSVSASEYDVLTGKGGTVTPKVQEIMQAEAQFGGAAMGGQAGQTMQQVGGMPENNLRTRAEAGQQMLQENVQAAEQAGVFESRPEEVSLQVSEDEQINSLGVSNKEFKEVMAGGDIPKKRIKNLIENPETLRQALLQEIQREELDKGLTASQILGATLEPFLGDLKILDVDVGQYADNLLRMPTSEVDSITQQIREMEGIVSGMTDAAAQGEIGNPQEVLRDVANYEEQLAVYEARIKRLILSSSQLRANPETVNEIQLDILKARETIFEAKQRAGEGALVTPTNEQLYSKLQQIRSSSK